MGPHVLRTSLGLAALPLALWACGADEESDAAQACPDNASVPLGPDRDGDCVSDADDLFPDDPDDRLVRIEAGEFVMGSAMDWGDLGGGGPQHWVQITRPFLMGPTEVTQALWLSVMGDNPSTFG